MITRAYKMKGIWVRRIKFRDEVRPEKIPQFIFDDRESQIKVDGWKGISSKVNPRSLTWENVECN